MLVKISDCKDEIYFNKILTPSLPVKTNNTMRIRTEFTEILSIGSLPEKNNENLLDVWKEKGIIFLSSCLTERELQYILSMPKKSPQLSPLSM